MLIRSYNSNIVTNEELLKLIPTHRTFAEDDTFCETDKRDILMQASTGPLGSLRLRLPEFLDSWYRRWYGRQPYTLTAFTPQDISLVLISVIGWVNPKAIVRLEGLSQWKIPMTPGNQAHDLLSCNPVTQCLNQLCQCISRETDNLLQK